jgi:CheY-like chemotaxis protein
MITSGGSERGLRILLADDNEDALTSLSMLLELEGHEVEGGSDGEQALEKLMNFRPDVAILDINMPKMSGYDVAKRLVRQVPNVSLIALSGWSQSESIERGKRAGFDFHVTKPVDLELLRVILRRIAHGRL